MTQRNHSAENRLHQLWHKCLSTRRFASTLPAQSLAWLGSISMLSNGGLVFAQTESAIDNIVPTAESSQPEPSANILKRDTVERNNKPSTVEGTQSQSEFSQRRFRLRQRLSKTKRSNPVVVLRKFKRQSQDSQPVTIRKFKLQAEVSVPTQSVSKWRARLERKPQLEVLQSISRVRREESTPELSQQNNSSAYSANNSTPKDYNNAYLDPNDYPVSDTKKYESPNSVAVTQRVGRCKTIIGQNIPNSVCARVPFQNRLNAHAKTESQPRKTPSWIRKSKATTFATVPPVRRVATEERNSVVHSTPRSYKNVTTRVRRRRSFHTASSSVTKETYRSNRLIPNLNPTTTVSSVPIAPAAGALPLPMTSENVAPRASNVTYDIPLASVLPQVNYSNFYGGRLASGPGLMYPLSLPSAISSVFGWRIHPITGDRRFHTGTDIGAATGTPVLAAYSGKVESADWLGGYGMTVILNHNSAQQTLYGHMSEIFVQPGQWVEKGTVIGRVGSTGLSTGPHLHFEVRQLTPEGWVATDPGTQLEYALGQLIQSLQTSQTLQQPGS
ncbi:M23 family metallopeptidase [Brasilonema sp. UFV-L1]|uniref:M23 family metallopeptidase n=1 Tax=Brasilonema sp. UFV-L1 TaxID=2234130 RepID=UPI00145CA674|nr:M23 family metallopeptidase [Brasilonema sp. UFV-L1]NMG11698.1 M23 family peptidase [Brasilonema sp. UFV-L1]